MLIIDCYNKTIKGSCKVKDIKRYGLINACFLSGNPNNLKGDKNA